MKLTAVIILTYGGSDFREMLKSIYNKSHPFDDVVVFNNESKMGSDELDSLRHKYHFRCIKSSQGRLNSFQSRLKALEYVESDYVWLLDEDDRFLLSDPTELRGMLLEGYDIIQGNYSINGRPASNHIERLLTRGSDNFWESYGLTWGCGDAITPHLWNKVFRRELLNNSSIKKASSDGKIYLLEDDIILTFLLADGQVKKIFLWPEQVYDYIKDNSTITNFEAPKKNLEKLQSLFRVFEEEYNLFLEIGGDILKCGKGKHWLYFYKGVLFSLKRGEFNELSPVIDRFIRSNRKTFSGLLKKIDLLFLYVSLKHYGPIAFIRKGGLLLLSIGFLRLPFLVLLLIEKVKRRGRFQEKY